MTIETDIELQNETDDDRVTCPLCDGDGQSEYVCCNGNPVYCGCRGKPIFSLCDLCDGECRVPIGVAESIDWKDYKGYQCEHNDTLAELLQGQKNDAFKAKWKGEN